MWHGEFSVSTKGSGTVEDPYGPELKTYQVAWSDVTGIPVPSYTPDPNAMNIYAKGDQAVIDAMAVDDDFFAHWYEEIPVEVEE